MAVLLSSPNMVVLYNTSFCSVVIMNAMNKDHGLIQIKWLEKCNTLKVHNVTHTDRPSNLLTHLYILVQNSVCLMAKSSNALYTDFWLNRIKPIKHH